MPGSTSRCSRSAGSPRDSPTSTRRASCEAWTAATRGRRSRTPGRRPRSRSRTGRRPPRSATMRARTASPTGMRPAGPSCARSWSSWARMACEPHSRPPPRAPRPTRARRHPSGVACPATGGASWISCRARARSRTRPRSPTWWRRSRSTMPTASSCRCVRPRGGRSPAWSRRVASGRPRLSSGWRWTAGTSTMRRRRWTGRPTSSRFATRLQRRPRRRTWSPRRGRRRTTRTPGALPNWPWRRRMRTAAWPCCEQVAGASDVVEAPRDWFTEVGLDDADPASEVAVARSRLGASGPRSPPRAPRPVPSSSSGRLRRRDGRRS